MRCDGVYQSDRCCEFSELWTTPCQSLTDSHRHSGSRPIASSMAAAPTTMTAPAIKAEADRLEVGATSSILLLVDASRDVVLRQREHLQRLVVALSIRRGRDGDILFA